MKGANRSSSGWSLRTDHKPCSESHEAAPPAMSPTLSEIADRSVIWRRVGVLGGLALGSVVFLAGLGFGGNLVNQNVVSGASDNFLSDPGDSSTVLKGGATRALSDFVI